MRPGQEALADYERARNAAVKPMYELTPDLAQLRPPPPEMQALMAAMAHDEVQAGRFLGTIAGTVPIDEFYSPANVGPILGAASLV